MPHIGPIKRKDLIYYLKESRVVRIPNPHQGDISESLLIRILKQAGMGKADWEKL